MSNEIAISLAEAARHLGLACRTVFAKRRRTGFRLPVSRVWLVWRVSPYSAERLESVEQEVDGSHDIVVLMLETTRRSL